MEHYNISGGGGSTTVLICIGMNIICRYVLKTGMYRCVFNHKWHATHLWGQGGCCCTTHAIRGRGHKRERERDDTPEQLNTAVLGIREAGQAHTELQEVSLTALRKLLLSWHFL